MKDLLLLFNQDFVEVTSRYANEQVQFRNRQDELTAVAPRMNQSR